MSENQLPTVNKQTNHARSPSPKKPRSKRKALSKRSNHKRATASAPKKQPEHDLKQAETEAPANIVADRHKAKDFLFVDTFLELDAFLLGDEASFSEPAQAASLSGIDLDAFLLEDTGGALPLQGEPSHAALRRGELDIRPPVGRGEATVPDFASILEDEVEVASPESERTDAGDHKGPPHPSQPPSPLRTSAPIDRETHPISDFEEEHSLEPLLTAPSSVSEDINIASEDVDTSQAVLIDVDGDSDVAVGEQDPLPQVIDTPLPPSIEDDKVPEVPYSLKEWYPEGEGQAQGAAPTDTYKEGQAQGAAPTDAYSYKHWYESRRWQVLRKVVALCLLALFVVSSVLLWRDVTDTHLYVYTLDPSSGDVVAQQDIGSGYQGKTTITNAVQAGSTLVFGVRTAQTSTSVKQKILTLTGRGASWHVDNQFAAGQAVGAVPCACPVPTSSGTLGTTTDGHLFVENANGLQVMNSNGHVLWGVQGDQPALGAHAFQPVSGDKTLYTVKSASLGEVAAFDLSNGTPRWMESLNDTFNYSPPLLLNAGILYLAGDSNLYALNSVDGSLLWQKNWAVRSLFILNNGQEQAQGTAPMLLTVGAQGLAAFDATTGALTWSFHGQQAGQAGQAQGAVPTDAAAGQPTGQAQGAVLTDTAAQFYQAGIDSGNKMIYATGIVWDALQVQEQLWLYAVDGTTGTLRWSEPIGSGFTSADAGRVFTPLVDPDYGLVTLEQEQDNGDYSISAFDTGTGANRWNIHFDGEMAAAPMLLQASSQALLHLKIPHGKKHLNAAIANIPATILIVPITQSNIFTAFQSWSHQRLLLMLLIALSLLGLLFLWMFPLHIWILRQQDHLHNIRHDIKRFLLYPLKMVVRFWRGRHKAQHRLFALAILLLFVGGGVLEYMHLNQPENGLYAFAGSTGNTQWQRINTSPTQTMLADAQGSIDNFTAGDQLHQLSGLDRNGVVQWTTFASEGVFSVPSIPTSPGTVLVALSGPTTLPYRFAPDDPAYPHLQQHILNVYLLNRGTGQILWQSNIVRPDQQQDAVVLGADSRFIYIASKETNAGLHGLTSTMQLIAVNSSTGDIEWHIFGPSEAIDAAPDYGSLLLQDRLIIWQVAGTIYSIDTTLGQIQWRRSIIENNPNALRAEEPHMAEASGVLLIERSSIYRVLDATSGNELQTIPNPNSDTVPSLAGVTVVGKMFLIYGDSTVEAINATTQQIIWKQDEFDAIEGLKVSDDKKMVYVVQLNSVDQSLSTSAQALTALDIKTGAVLWTFQPASQASFVNPQSDGFQYSRGILFVTLCMPDTHSSCARERLYAINGTTGNVLWKFEAKSIFDLHVSPDGGAVFLQTHSTEWINLIGRFRS